VLKQLTADGVKSADSRIKLHASGAQISRR